ncbi:MATE family efflux transporter [Pseudoflavonifractor sp. MSJ-37]|uniref:MATE family efflux transporter n=1 Tax=Pseudoflavonifractor sp. MSJ-37 TaxID=2841531 RepID=UPI001C111DC2|nr:MATE family efflux transporter [Pseudoflavonifractor sp. MSJ-37]MBU5434263.1 MATE family efflux transporter [Pseudoflavonifractor sp. MSJ-37]
MDRTENRMGVMPIRRLVLSMSWPMMLSMLVQALYNMVDSVFVSWLNNDAFVALSLVFPVQSLITAIQAGTGVGVNTMLSRRLGQKRTEEARAVAVHGYAVYLCYWLVFALAGWFGARPFMMLYTDQDRVIEYGVTYLRIVTILSLGSCMQFATERVLQAGGNAVGPMIIQGLGAVTNLVLDPILIFGLLGVPAMGVAGAALATGLGQLVGMLIGLTMVARKGVVKVSLKGFRPQAAVLADIYRIGVPAIAMQSLFTVMSLGMNKILGLFSETGVFIMGAYFKAQSFIFMPTFGLNNGLTPVVSYNYGAKSPERVSGAIRFALQIGGTIMLAGMLIFWLVPGPLLSLFRADEATLAAGIPALRILSLTFLPACVSILLSSAFQAVGKPSYSLWLSLFRQMLLLFPTALLLGRLAGPGAVWYAFVIAEGLPCIAAALLYRRVYRTGIAPIDGLS